jgi:hypothetical protein
MDYTETIGTTADPSRTWQALAAVTSYPQWTPSMSSVSGLDGRELAVGRRFRIRQPGLAPIVWRVTQVRDGEEFTWEYRTTGLHMEANHRVSANADGTTQITLTLRQSGPLTGLIRLLTGSRTVRYMALEAAGVRAAAES